MFCAKHRRSDGCSQLLRCFALCGADDRPIHCGLTARPPLAEARVRTHMSHAARPRCAHALAQCNADYQFLEESQRSLDVAVRLQRELGAQGYKPLTYKLKMLSTKALSLPTAPVPAAMPESTKWSSLLHAHTLQPWSWP